MLRRNLLDGFKLSVLNRRILVAFALCAVVLAGAIPGRTFASEEADRDVLVALYRNTGGNNWLRNDLWLSGEPIGTWYGVITDGEGRVIELSLSENDLIGAIPPELGKLTELEWLDLADNLLSGPIPPELGNLTNLEALYLDSNLLSGPIPPELGNLTNLSSLFLSNNLLIGQIPSELGRLSKLEGLSLWGNELRGLIPPELFTLSNLNFLFLGLGNQFTGCVPESWRSLDYNDIDFLDLPFCIAPSPTITATDRDVLIALYQATNGASWSNRTNWLTEGPLETWYGVTADENGSVTDLTLSENELRGVIPPVLGNLRNLEWLDLSKNELSGTIPPELGNLQNLRGLALGGNSLSGEIPPELGNLLNLTGLALWSNGLSGSIPSEIGNLSKLRVLYLSNNTLSGSIPPELGKLTNLEGLTLWNNRLSGTIPIELGDLIKLEELDLEGNRLTGAIPGELGNLTRLEGLYLSGNQLSGCVPQAWRNVEENDLEDLGLPFCVASTTTSPANSGSLTSIQIFEKVSPAIAFIETATSTGSGVLLEEGYLVTNAHVVWPFNEARVVFPDGAEFDAVPVIGWDNLADLAVLGPINIPTRPVTLTNGEDLPIGADVFLIGYPGEFESFPQPAIGRGLLARLREWEPVGITYFQTDAIAIGGQSGGALVSTMGDVIGISGFRITEGKFGFVASSADLLPRIQQLVAGEDPSGLGDRRLPIQMRRHRLKLRNYWDDLVFVIDEPIGTRVEIELTGDKDGRVFVTDQIGDELLNLDKEGIVVETGSFIVRKNGPHFLVVRQMVESPAQFTLAVNRRLTQFNDPDRGGRVQVGQSTRGNMDYPGDVDHFLLQLEENETVEIIARSALADVILTIDFLGATGEQIVQDDDSGGGLFGLDSKIAYRAPHSGNYFVVVRDASRSAPGGYIISVRSTGQEAVARSNTSSRFGCEQVRSSLGDLLASFLVLDPADLESSPESMVDPVAEEKYSHVVVFAKEDGSQMIVTACGQITEVVKSAYDRQSDALVAALQSGPITERENNVLKRLQLLEMAPIGEISVGMALDTLGEDEQSRLETITFRRGNYVVSVSNLSYLTHDLQDIVWAEQVARAIDEKMND